MAISKSNIMFKVEELVLQYKKCFEKITNQSKKLHKRTRPNGGWANSCIPKTNRRQCLAKCLWKSSNSDIFLYYVIDNFQINISLKVYEYINRIK
jgi:hypothetical protein